MPKVYVLNRGMYDYSAAERYGRLIYCSDGPLKKHDLNQMVRLLAKALDESAPEDYIVLTSLASLCALAAAIFTSRHGRLNLLVYKNGQYHEHNITFRS